MLETHPQSTMKTEVIIIVYQMYVLTYYLYLSRYTAFYLRWLIWLPVGLSKLSLDKLWLYEVVNTTGTNTVCDLEIVQRGLLSKMICPNTDCI